MYHIGMLSDAKESQIIGGGHVNKKAAHPHIRYADDDKYPISTLALMRLPSLFGGLFLGIGLSFATSRFEEVISESVQIAFFIPFVVYMAAAVGSQTQTIYARDLRSGKAKFTTYLIKETALGLILGIIFGLASWLISDLWFGVRPVSHAVGLSMLAVISTAPLVGLVITEIFQLEHQDPAVGAGPVATVIQDTISVLVYGSIATAIIL